MKKVILLAIFLMLFTTQKALAVGLTLPFGGMSIFTQLCTCDGSYMITLNNAANFNMTEYYIYSPLTSVLYENFIYLTPGVNMVGEAEPLPMQCLMASPSGCTPAGIGYPIIQFGTSNPF